MSDAPAWAEANRALLDLDLRRLRLLLHRRALWLRARWSGQSPAFQGLVIGEAEADWLLAGGQREAEREFRRDDERAATIGRALDDLARERAASDAASGLDALARQFGLSAFERDVVLLCAAPEFDPTFERLYAYVQDDATRRHATPHLALALFAGDDWAAARDSFLPGAPLRRFRLVHLDGGAAVMGSRPLRADDRIVDYLVAINRPDERLHDLARPVSDALLSAEHRALVERLLRWLEGGPGPWPVLNLVGPPGAGKRAVARALGDAIGLQVLGLEPARLPAAGPDRHETLHLLEREAMLLPAAYYVDLDALGDGEPQAAAAAGDAIERLGAFVIVGGGEPWQGERERLAVRVPKPDAGAQRALWRAALAAVPHGVDGHLDAIVQQFEFGSTTIARAVASAAGHARLRGADGVSSDDLWQACRDHAVSHLDRLAQRIVPCHTWQDIVLPDDAFRQLREIAAQVAWRARVYEGWGFGAKLSRGRGISALFSGPSGTGKTLAAEILADHLRLDLYRIDLSAVVSKYIGETEKNLRRVFDAAEQSGAILFFDEADALFGKRSEVKDSHDRYANIEINYLLQRMEEYRGLAILATNMKSHLDQAFLRRLRFLVDFPFPDAAHRLRIWQRAFPPGAPTEGLDAAFLARLEITGGNIRNIALNAAFLAASESAPIRMAHVMHAARREYAKIDKLIREAEFGPYHEAVAS